MLGASIIFLTAPPCVGYALHAHGQPNQLSRDRALAFVVLCVSAVMTLPMLWIVPTMLLRALG